MKKVQSILATAVALGVAVTSATADTEITITGATAFRQATMLAIVNAYNSVGAGGVAWNAAHDFPANATNQVSQLIASNKAVISGSFPGLTGVTTIRTSFNGSTEGLNAIAGNNDPSFLTTAALSAADPDADGIRPAQTSPTQTLRPKFSFSDVYQSTSPITTPVLNPVGSSAVGVVTFTMVANEGAPANWTNVTQQQFKAVLQQGFQPLSLFTGDSNDSGTFVFATGRNDGSGTRSAYLTEIGYGVANTVQQYIVTTAGQSVAGEISAITLVPQGGNGTGNLLCPDGTGNASTLWGNDVLGNGGYRSSSALRGIMGRTSAVCDVYDGVNQAAVAEDLPVLLLTWLSTADAANAAGNGAKILGFNGVTVNPVGGFSATDAAKITNGQYSAWSYQHLYHHGSLSTEESAWRSAMVNTWLEPALVTTANGIPLGDMSAERPDDGAPIVVPF